MNTHNLYRLIKIMKGLWAKLILLTFFIIGTSIFSTYPIKYIEKAINISISDDPKKINIFFISCLIYFGLHVLNIIFQIGFEYLTSKLENNIGHNIRMCLYRKIQDISLSSYENKLSGDLLIKLVQDSNITVEGILKPILFITRDTLVFVFGFFYMYSIDKQLTLIMIPIGIIISLSSIFSGPSIRKLSYIERNTTSAFWGSFIESINGMKEIKSNSQEKRFLKYISDKSLETNKNLMNLNKYLIITKNINSMCFMLIISIIMFLGGYKVATQTLSIGGLIAIMMYNSLLIDPMVNFFELYQNMQRVLVSINRIFDILDEEDEDIGKKNYKGLVKEIRLENISFKYKDTYILNDISIDIKKGERIALVGQSGSGKSSICKLLLKLYNFQSGKIYIDNEDILNINSREIREKFGLVFQETFLFSGTLKENLMFTNPNASDKELKKVIEICELNDFILGLNEGLNTYISENGANISGGEKQRISIARILLKNPDVIILDESTSALDPLITASLIKNIINNYKEKTIIFVAHKLTNIVDYCDTIYVLNDGYLEEYGSHSDLIEKGNLYNKLYMSQFNN